MFFYLIKQIKVFFFKLTLVVIYPELRHNFFHSGVIRWGSFLNYYHTINARKWNFTMFYSLRFYSSFMIPLFWLQHWRILGHIFASVFTPDDANHYSMFAITKSCLCVYPDNKAAGAKHIYICMFCTYAIYSCM